MRDDCRYAATAAFSLCLFMLLCYLAVILVAMGVWIVVTGF